jgi:hypothetical protein
METYLLVQQSELLVCLSVHTQESAAECSRMHVSFCVSFVSAQGQTLQICGCMCAGKTLAFGLPALRHIQKQKSAGVVNGKGPFFICIAPTRELAQQISTVLEDSGSQCGLGCCCVYGGVPKQEQAKVLGRGVDMVVGTPGRMLDLMQDGTLDLSVRSCAAIGGGFR